MCQNDVGVLLSERFESNLPKFLQSDAGKIHILLVRQLEISSSLVRKLFKENKSAQFLVPDAVLEYINKNQLYGQLNLKADELKDIAVDALDDLKAKDVVVIDVRNKSNVTDIMIVATGT